MVWTLVSGDETKKTYYATMWLAAKKIKNGLNVVVQIVETLSQSPASLGLADCSRGLRPPEIQRTLVPLDLGIGCPITIWIIGIIARDATIFATTKPYLRDMRDTVEKFLCCVAASAASADSTTAIFYKVAVR